MAEKLEGNDILWTPPLAVWAVTLGKEEKPLSISEESFLSGHQQPLWPPAALLQLGMKKQKTDFCSLGRLNLKKKKERDNFMNL